MRKLVAVELVSLDGVMESPGEWAFGYSDDDMNEANAAGMTASDAMLLGLATYEDLAAFWPNQPAGHQPRFGSSRFAPGMDRGTCP